MTTNPIPTMRPHAKGQARVTLCGHTIYLGRWGSPEATDRYNEVIAAWLGNARQWPIVVPTSITVSEIVKRYHQHVLSYYTKRGGPSSHAIAVVRATELLLEAGLGQVLAVDFRPRYLKAYLLALAADEAQRWNRTTINGYTRCVVQMFGWAIDAEMLGDPADRQGQLSALKNVRGLKRGRSPAADIPSPREGRVIEPAAIADVKAVQAVVTPTVRDMIEFHLLTGARPTEVVHLRTRDIVASVNPSVRLYRVAEEWNKNGWRGIARTVYIGPKAWSIIAARMPASPDAFVFSPRQARAEADGARRDTRTLPRWPSHSSERRRRARGSGPILLNESYSTQSYGRCVSRACETAGVPHWAPNQLRHTAATYIEEAESLEVAQILLGHADIATTRIYAKKKELRAINAVAKLG